MATGGEPTAFPAVRRDGAPWRISVRRTDDGIGIYNPTRRKIRIVLFLTVWLAGWSAGEYFVLAQIFSSAIPLGVSAFLLIWVTLWTIAGIVVMSVLAWQLLGVEKLYLIDAGAIVTERGFGPFTRRRVFRPDQVSDGGFGRNSSSGGVQGFLAKGAVRFTADGKSYGFGIELDPEEARLVMDLVRDFLARHRDTAGRTASNELPGGDARTAGRGAS